MKKLGILMLTLALLLSGCGAAQERESASSDEGQNGPAQAETTMVYVPMWMEAYSVVYYDADLNRTIETGRDLTEEEIAGRDDIDPSMMYGSLLAEPNTKVTYDLHGFIQNIYYLSDDGINYQLAPPEARG